MSVNCSDLLDDFEAQEVLMFHMTCRVCGVELYDLERHVGVCGRCEELVDDEDLEFYEDC